MSLPVVATIDEGIDRLTDRQYLTVFLVLVLAHLTLSVGTQSQLAAQPEELATEPLFGEDLVPEELPLAVELSFEAATVMWLAGLVGLVAASLFALRALVSNDPSRLGPGAAAALTAHGIAATLVLALAVGLGLLAFVIPGLFLVTVFAFTLPYVAIERVNALEGMRRSWGLTAGNRLRVFAVLVGTVVGFFGITFFGAAIAVVIAGVSQVGGELVNVVFTALAWLFVLAVLASAFDRLEEARTREEEKWDGVDDDLLP